MNMMFMHAASLSTSLRTAGDTDKAVTSSGHAFAAAARLAFTTTEHPDDIDFAQDTGAASTSAGQILNGVPVMRGRSTRTGKILTFRACTAPTAQTLEVL